MHNNIATRLFKFLLAVCFSTLVAQTSVSAQGAEGFLGWVSEPGRPAGYFLNPEEACRAQWQYYNGNPKSRFVGALDTGDPNVKKCSWTTFQYLCPEETGYGINSCGTVLPHLASLRCGAGYTPVHGMCRKSEDLVPERPCYCNNGGSPNPTVGNPFVLATGAKILSARDFATADDEFVISRSYRSMPIGRSINAFGVPLGLAGNWAFDFALELQLGQFQGSPSSPNAKLALVAPDGSAYDFTMQGGGAWASDPATGAYFVTSDYKVEYLGTLPASLSDIPSSSSQWRVTDTNDTVWIFQTFPRPIVTTAYTVGRPISRTTRNGYRWDFTYDSDGTLKTIRDSFNRQASFTWHRYYLTTLASPPAGSEPAPEAIATIALPDGSSLFYTYDPDAATSAPSSARVQRLTKVERRTAGAAVIDATSYDYADPRFPRHLTSVKRADGVESASYSYDARGRGITTALAEGTNNHRVTSAETGTEVTRAVTRPLGKNETYRFQRFGGGAPDYRVTRVDGQPSVTTPASTASLTYGADNFVATSTDEEGRVTTYARDSRGRPTTIVEAAGTPQQRTTTITWHATLNLPVREVRTGLQVDYTYSPTGQLLTRSEADTTSHSTPYSTAGQTRTWTYSWGAGGRLESLNGPKPVDAQGKDDTLTFAYDAAGNLQTSTNGLGHITSFANYDANGRPGTMTDPNGAVTQFTYDTRGRTRTITAKHPSTAALDAVTTLDYDIADRVVGITSPATEKLFIDYNAAGRVTAVRAASGERIDYQTDAQGNVVAETVKHADATLARSVKRTFDELGRLLSESLGPDRTSALAYDKVGNLTQTRTPNGGATTQAFDALDRLVTTTAPDSGTTTRGYDARDNLTSNTDPISVVTQFVHNGFGEVIQEVSPDRGTSTHYYNAAGELTASIDGRGQRIDYTRDILGRVTQKTPVGRQASETITYTWDTPGIAGSSAVGRLSSVADATGTTSFAYDHRGNLTAKRQTIGNGTADLAYAYDLGDRVTQISYPSGRLVHYAYDGKGRVSQIQTRAAGESGWTVLASGLSYEPFGSIKAMALGNGLAVANDWGDDGRLAARRLYRSSGGADLSHLAYTYDGNDNIGAMRDRLNEANSVYHGYDANDRLTLTSRTMTTAAAEENYSYTPGTNRLAAITSEAGTRTIGYDARGNTVSETRPGGGTVSVSYDGYGRLLTYARSGEPAQANAYNGLDDRVSVTATGEIRRFVYAPDGRVLGEYGASAAEVIGETIWLSPEVANDNQPFGGDDGVGGYAPLAVATSASLTWLHGNHLGVPLAFTDASGAVVAPPSYTLPGFPGQMKTLSDLYYNRHRDYDVATGRYIQADPIGLGGGSNPYLYAEANPLKHIDPSGLEIGNQRLFFPEFYPKPTPRPRELPYDPKFTSCAHYSGGTCEERTLRSICRTSGDERNTNCARKCLHDRLRPKDRKDPPLSWYYYDHPVCWYECGYPGGWR